LRARRAERGLRSHRTREGCVAGGRRPAPRAPERDAPRHDRDRPPGRAAPLGRDPHGDGLRLAGRRHVALGGDLQPRLSRPAGRDPLPRDRVRVRQPSRRHRLRLHQPEDPRRMSVAELEGEVLGLEPPSGLWHEAWVQIRHNRGAQIGFFFVGLFVVTAIFAPLLAPYDPLAQDYTQVAHGCCPGPSSSHWLGVDQLGRDELSRIIYGARLSLVVGVVAVSVGLTFGMILGAIAGYFGGTVDNIIMRLMDIMLSIPGLLMAIGIVAVLGPGLVQVMIAIGVTQIPIFARLLRGSILSQRENEFVVAARSVGVRRRQILWGHILPNSISPVIVQGTLALATAII